MHKLLKKIKTPADVKALSFQQLNELADEIRNKLINTISENGGHLSSNLGVVELTLALHSTFDLPEDKIIWDVGHQSYVHKLLTGRLGSFHTLRQYGGVSGFPKREESIYDAFNTGHSSTSISAAMGIAAARDIRGENFHVVAVIGDGALTGGMAFEALNHAGNSETDLIVILNDNEMSISQNVGALSSYLNRIRIDPKYQRVKDDVEYLLKHIPAIGKTLAKTVERAKDSLKYFLVPGMIFEELGFTYFGPIDGHNIESMRVVLENAKKRHGPILIHVLTQKGKGYKPAEDKPNKFHGVGPFDIASGEKKNLSQMATYSQIFGAEMVKIGEERNDLVAISAAMIEGTGLEEFHNRFPARIFDVGIAEQHAVTFAAGLAVQGMKPVVAIYSTFLQRAYDQIVHDVCLQNLPVTFALDRAGIVGEDGPTHHGLFDFAYLRHIPNMVVMAPADLMELKIALRTAMEWDGPIAIRYPRGEGKTGEMEHPLRPVEIGKGRLLQRGKDGTILAIGTMVHESLLAAKLLEKNGIRVSVVDCRFVKPLDRELIVSLAKKSACFITVEEHALCGGFGSAVLELLQEEGLHGVPFLSLGIPDNFIKHGQRKILLQELGLTAEGIANAFYRKKYGKNVPYLFQVSQIGRG